MAASRLQGCLRTTSACSRGIPTRHSAHHERHIYTVWKHMRFALLCGAGSRYTLVARLSRISPAPASRRGADWLDLDWTLIGLSCSVCCSQAGPGAGPCREHAAHRGGEYNAHWLNFSGRRTVCRICIHRISLGALRLGPACRARRAAGQYEGRGRRGQGGWNNAERAHLDVAL